MTRGTANMLANEAALVEQDVSERDTLGDTAGETMSSAGYTGHIVVRNQKEWNKIPKDFDGCIVIDATEPIHISGKMPGEPLIKACGRSEVHVGGCASLQAEDKAVVLASEHAVVTARGEAYVRAHDHACVTVSEKARVLAQGFSRVRALDEACVTAMACSCVVASGRTHVHASDAATVLAWGKATVVALHRSVVSLFQEASAIVMHEVSADILGYGEIWAGGNSRVVACGRSRVYASGEAHVHAYRCAYVEATDYSQVVRYSKAATIQLQGQARELLEPTTAREFCRQKGVEVRNGRALLYVPGHDGTMRRLAENAKTKPGKRITLPQSVWVWSKADAICREASWLTDREHRIYEVAVRLADLAVDQSGARTTKLTILRELQIDQWGAWKSYAELVARDKEKRGVVYA
ncbi:MAG: hypothetical protein ACPLRM_02910 [Anaerolineae bacterium]